MVSLHKDSQEEGICPICLELLKEAVSTNCAHLFCRMCLIQHVEKTLTSGVLCCPVCRKPCSEEVLGEGYICPLHQKRVCRFCEKTGSLLCVECLELPEHQSHPEPTIENAISHYKERLVRRSRKLRKDIGEFQRLKAQEEEKLCALQVDLQSPRLEAELENHCQTKGQLDALSQQQLNRVEDTPAEVARILDLSKAIIQLSNLVADLEKMARELDANTLKVHTLRHLPNPGSLPEQ
ncbi:E3 ubiquitin ligase TRIM40 isoform X1 [Castor canadensis]|uniref:E3 ubiquitin ligase TRIM40 isoform X1 n=1 Tax=Castor canadensis TaxID=51338 RepID=A0AC58NAX4_CASCN